MSWKGVEFTVWMTGALELPGCLQMDGDPFAQNMQLPPTSCVLTL